jgi:hypothetical protein
MTTSEPRRWPQLVWVLATLGGPVALGAVIGMPFGAPSMLRLSIALPGVLIGLTLLMVPALYIGLSLMRAAPPAAQVVAAAGCGLRACGTVLAGLAPATAFLVATAADDLLPIALGTLVVAGAALVGIRRVFRELLTDGVARLRAAPVLAAWAVVSLLLGAQLFLSLWDPQL